MVVGELYTNVKNLLKKGGISNYRREAAFLLEHFIHVGYQEIALNDKRPVDISLVKALQNGVDRRLSGYPLQYILGSWEFYGIEFYVGEGVLIPRSDTETLVDVMLEEAFRRTGKPLKICDLCAGSGCVALALEQELYTPQTGYHQLFAVEKSQEAAQYFVKNAKRYMSRIHLVEGDVFDNEVIVKFKELDMVSCNPPYLSSEDMSNLQKEVGFEPKEALYGGQDGLDFYRHMIPIWKETLALGGMMALEIGMGQDCAVREIMENNNFSRIVCREDLSGIIRVVAGYRDN